MDSTEATMSILIVDDNEVDALALRRAFAKARIENPIHVVVDGVAALELLRGENGKEALQKPYVVLLDLNMPRMNGLEFLEEIRSDEDLGNTIVFVLSTSAAEEDIAAAYEHKIAGYIVKENSDFIVKEETGSNLIEAICMLESFWNVVQLPR